MGEYDLVVAFNKFRKQDSRTMKRRTLVIVLIFTFAAFTSMSLSADVLSYGVKGGVNFAKFGGPDAGFDKVYECKYKIGFSTGLFASVSPIDIIAIQSAILFSSKGTKVEFEGFEGLEFDHLYYIEIPLLLKFYPIKISIIRINIFSGPYLGMNVINIYKTTDDVKDFYELLDLEPEGEYEDVKTLDFGLVFGLGVDIGRILIEGSFSLGLTTTDDSAFEFDLKNRVLTIMLGYRFK